MTDEPEKKKELTLSNSSLSTFKQCPRKYYYEYVLRLPRKPKDYFTLGTFVHYVLELFYKSLIKDRTQKLSELMKICFIQARSETPEATPLILADAKSMLQDYLVRVIAHQKLPKDMALENKFNIEINGIRLTGVIDRIDFGEGGEIVVIDYKTGKKAKSAKDFAEDLQLPLYTMAVQQIYNATLEQITCKLDHLKVKSEQPLKPTQQIIEKAQTTIVESHGAIQQQYREMEDAKWSIIGPPTVEKIKESKEWSKAFEDRFVVFIAKFAKFWEPHESYLCNYCDYLKICRNTMW